jgi:hypothetical protein
MTLLQKAVAPNLPLAPDAYTRLNEESFRNVLRLYFNILSTDVSSLVGDTGGRFIQYPYAAVQSNADISFTANTASQILFDTNDYLNACTNDGTDGITVSYAGIYNYQFSVQLKNTDTQIHSAWIWLRVNGVDVPGTGSKFDVTSSHGGTPGFVIAACNFYVELQGGDTIEMWAAVDNTAVTFDSSAAQTSPFPMPAVPAVVATLSFVSALAT